MGLKQNLPSPPRKSKIVSESAMKLVALTSLAEKTRFDGTALFQKLWTLYPVFSTEPELYAIEAGPRCHRRR